VTQGAVAGEVNRWPWLQGDRDQHKGGPWPTRSTVTVTNAGRPWPPEPTRAVNYHEP